MLTFTIGTIRTKPKHVIFANYHGLALIVNPIVVAELALLLAELAEATLKVRTKLLLFPTTWVLFQRMPVNTLILDVTVAILLIELADGNSILFISVQILARVALPACVFEPVNAHLLLYLVLRRRVIERFDNFFKLIDAHDLSVACGRKFIALSRETTILMLIIA